MSSTYQNDLIVLYNEQPSCSNEYKRWQFYESLLKLITGSSEPKTNYEAITVLERFFINLYNLIKTSKLDVIEDTEVYRKFIQELRDKNIQTIPTLNQLNDLLNKIPLLPETDIIIDYDRMTIEYRDFKYQWTAKTRNIDILLEHGPKYFLILLLRYKSMVDAGLQWIVPRAVANLAYEHNFTIECFASPQNSSFIGRGHFCSLFLDTDFIYGSLGSFFDLELNKTDGYYIVPPFTEQIFDLIWDKIKDLSWLKAFICLPKWTDTPLYQGLLAWPNVHIIQLKKGTYKYESLKADIKCNYNSTLFILNGPSDNNFYTHILRNFSY